MCYEHPEAAAELHLAFHQLLCFAHDSLMFCLLITFFFYWHVNPCRAE